MTEPARPNDADEPIDAREAERIKRRARIGAFALALRTVAHQLTVLAGTVLLARILLPSDFGVFVIVQFALSFFAFFGDVGLGASLIRQKEEPTQRQLSTVFWFQVCTGFGIVVVVALVASFVRLIWPELPASAPWLMRAIAFDLLLTALRAVPSLLLERHLEFPKLAIIEVVVQMSFYVVAIPLAFRGLGVWSLAVALIVQGVVGLVAVLRVRPWRPSFVFDREGLRPMLKFGLAYQGKAFIGFINGAVTPLYAGAALGTTALGFINWAQSTAYFPLKVVEILARVNFPLYARFQNDKARFAETLGKSIQVCAVATFAIVAVFFGLGPQVTHVVFTDKWLPAVNLLYIYSATIMIGFVSPIVGAALDGAGKPGIIFRLAIGWTALCWILVLIATPRWGVLGYVLGYVAHVVIGNAAVLYVVRRLFPATPLFRVIAGPLVAGVASTAFLKYVAARWVEGPFTLTGAIFAGGVVFALALGLVDRQAVRDFIEFVRPKKKAANDGEAEAQALR